MNKYIVYGCVALVLYVGFAAAAHNPEVLENVAFEDGIRCIRDIYRLMARNWIASSVLVLPFAIAMYYVHSYKNRDTLFLGVSVLAAFISTEYSKFRRNELDLTKLRQEIVTFFDGSIILVESDKKENAYNRLYDFWERISLTCTGDIDSQFESMSLLVKRIRDFRRVYEIYPRERTLIQSVAQYIRSKNVDASMDEEDLVRRFDEFGER